MVHSIYADNAATTKLDIDAFEAMKPFLLEDYGNASQPYAFARKPKKALDDARAMIAECIGSLPEEIYFTSGGTESDNWAIKSVISEAHRNQIITSQIEHHAILNSCSALERLGCPVVYLPVDINGTVSSKALESAITKKTKIVSIMLVNNEIGTIEPIRELANIAHSNKATFHTDAVQAIGHIPIDVHELGVDMLSASAHKFNGPKGIGFLYLRNSTAVAPYINGGMQENKMRAGTENIASIVGMAVALKKSCDEMKQTTKKLNLIEGLFFDTICDSNIDYVRNGGYKRVPGIISISFRDINGETLLHRLDLKGISIATGSACDSVNTQVSHVIRAIGLDKEYAEGTVRISFGRENKVSDAYKVARSIIEIVKSK